MQVTDIERPSMIAKEVHPKGYTRGKVYRRSSARHFVRREENSAIQLNEGSNVPASSKDPLQTHRVHSCTVCSVCRLEDEKCRHRIHGELESSPENAWQVRLRQNPSIADARVPHTRVAGTPRPRVSATGPHLEFVASRLWPILGHRQRR